MILGKYFRINHPNVIHETIDKEVVIVNLDSGNYYSLENIGADIWESINLKASLDDIVGVISLKYEGDQNSVIDGIDHFISQLLEEELIGTQEPKEPQTKSITNPSVKSEEKSPFTGPVLNKYSDMQDLLLLDPIHEVDEQGWPHSNTNPNEVPKKSPD